MKCQDESIDKDRIKKQKKPAPRKIKCVWKKDDDVSSICSDRSVHYHCSKRYLIHCRLPESSRSSGPGPNAYYIRNLNFTRRNAPSYSFGQKILDKDVSPSTDFGPPPNAYALPDLIGTGGGFYPWFPGFTIAGKRKIKDSGGTYPPYRNIDYKSHCSPKFTLKGRLDPLPPQTTPSSYAYRPECANRKLGPSWSFGIKHSPHKIIPIA